MLFNFDITQKKTLNSFRLGLSESINKDVRTIISKYQEFNHAYHKKSNITKYLIKRYQRIIDNKLSTLKCIVL